MKNEKICSGSNVYGYLLLENKCRRVIKKVNRKMKGKKKKNGIILNTNLKMY